MHRPGHLLHAAPTFPHRPCHTLPHPATPSEGRCAHMSNLLAVVLPGLHTIPVQLHGGVAASHPVMLLAAAKASQLLMACRCASSATTAGKGTG